MRFKRDYSAGIIEAWQTDDDATATGTLIVALQRLVCYRDKLEAMELKSRVLRSPPVDCVLRTQSTGGEVLIVEKPYVGVGFAY